MQKGRLALASAALLLVTSSLVACTTSHTCVSWVSFETPNDAFESSELAVIGTPIPTGATVELYGVSVPLYTVTVDTVLKGDAPPSLTVAPTPETCSSSSSPDPFRAGEPVVMLLSDYGGFWHPLTPFVGTYPADEPLPFEVNGLFDLQKLGD